jgi:hypothetical protein
MHPAIGLSVRYRGPNNPGFNNTFIVSGMVDGWLLVTDRWAAGWRGKANGNPVEVLGGNFIFRAVRIRAGENTIQFYYPQPLYFALVLLSWTTLGAVFATPGWKKLQGVLGCVVGRSIGCSSTEVGRQLS